MPRITPFRLAAVCALALSLTLAFAAGAWAKGPLTELRVVGAGGKVLTERPVPMAAVSVKTSPKADCFGPGTGGSGDDVQLKKNTALGLLANGAKMIAALRPLLISDSFDFGLALCGVGKSVAKITAGTSWYLKIDHEAQEVSGDVAEIEPGDEVLWALVKTEAPDFAYPDELALTAPNSVKAGKTFTVRVWAYDGKGRRTPQAGAKVTGAAAPTGADGRTTVTLKKPARLIARASGEIPSAREPVCVGGKCPK
ncbi:MAG TPA: hypothetical protein VHH14_07670 [Solirubrobacterales bacterium]|nr:hypothetical protein [Solirubrobacterales bacterium]